MIGLFAILYGLAASYGFTISGICVGGVTFSITSLRNEAVRVWLALVLMLVLASALVFECVGDDRLLLGGDAGGELFTTLRKGEETKGAVCGRMMVARGSLGGIERLALEPFELTAGALCDVDIAGVTPELWSSFDSSSILRRFDGSGLGISRGMGRAMARRLDAGVERALPAPLHTSFPLGSFFNILGAPVDGTLFLKVGRDVEPENANERGCEGDSAVVSEDEGADALSAKRLGVDCARELKHNFSGSYVPV